MAPERFASVLSDGEYEAFVDLVAHAARELHGRVVWNVNSTAKGGGVVEMLRPLLGYCRGAGVDALGRYFEVIQRAAAQREHHGPSRARQRSHFS